MRQGGGDLVAVAAQDVTDGGPGELEVLAPGQGEGEALGAQASLVLGGHHLLLYGGVGPGWLVVGGLRAVAQIPCLLFGQDAIDHGAGDAKRPGRGREVVAAGTQILQHGLARRLWVDPPEGLVVNTDARLHTAPS